MINFEFYNPTKVIFGKDTEKLAGTEIAAMGYKKVLVHYGSESAKKSGLIDRVCDSLKASGVEYVTLGGVQPNPRLKLAREGLELAKKEGVEFILAVGGGSVIDSSKAIAIALKNDCDVWAPYAGEIKPTTSAPVGCVLTIAAAGSETSWSSVITNDENGLKRSYNHDGIRPKFAIMNPELTYTLPPYQSSCGAVDILMHTMERYFTTVKNVDLTDRIAEGLLVSVMENAKKVHANPTDYAARAEIMWAGSISHNGLTGTGRITDFASHQIEHELSGMFDVAHGAGLSAIWASWARYVYKTDVARFAQYAVRVMGCEMDFQNPEATALEGIKKMEEFYKSIDMPTTITELCGKVVTEEEMKEMAHKCSFFGTRKIGNFKVLDENDMLNIYKMAL